MKARALPKKAANLRTVEQLEQIFTAVDSVTAERAARAAAKPLAPEEIRKITWDKLPTVKAEPVVLEPKPLFIVTGGDRNASRKP
jgi:hypothetical protein